jgi:hypothetical protein
VFLPFRAQVGDAYAYGQLGWGGILGAHFGFKWGIVLIFLSLLAGLALLLGAWLCRREKTGFPNGPERFLFCIGEIGLIALALATHL